MNQRSKSSFGLDPVPPILVIGTLRNLLMAFVHPPLRPLFLGAVLLGLLGCIPAVPRCDECAPPVPGPANLPKGFQVFVVSHGWHTGLVLRREEVVLAGCPELADFPDARWIELGWGDRDFYQAKEITIGVTLDALFWPDPGVVHVVGFTESPHDEFPNSEVVDLRFAQTAYSHLVDFICGSFERTAGRRAAKLRDGLYGVSGFYPSWMPYSFPHTCNVWTAQALKASGVPIDSHRATTARAVMKQLRRIDPETWEVMDESEDTATR